MLWQSSWQKFFDIYHPVIKLMLKKSFAANGMPDVPPHIVDETVSDVLVSLAEIFGEKKYDKTKTKFRSFLKTIANRRAIDRIRESSKRPKLEAIENLGGRIEKEANEAMNESFIAHIEDDEELAFRQAFTLDLYGSIRGQFDPKTVAAFEMIKFENKSPEEAAAELGISKNAANNRVYRVVKKLKQALQSEESKKELG